MTFNWPAVIIDATLIIAAAITREWWILVFAVFTGPYAVEQ